MGDKPSWYLYVWELADEQQFLDTTLQRLSPNVGASSAIASVTVSRKRKDWCDVSELTGRVIDLDSVISDSGAKSTVTEMKHAIDNLVASNEKYCLQEKELHVEQQINVVIDAIQNYRVQLAITKDKVFEILIKEKQEELENLKSKLISLTPPDE